MDGLIAFVTGLVQEKNLRIGLRFLGAIVGNRIRDKDHPSGSTEIPSDDVESLFHTILPDREGGDGRKIIEDDVLEKIEVKKHPLNGVGQGKVGKGKIRKIT